MSESGKVVAELTRLLDLREQQLADCTRERMFGSSLMRDRGLSNAVLEIGRLNKRIAMLEAERGPGMKPEPAPIGRIGGAMSTLTETAAEALRVYYPEAQVDVCVEECAELVKAICKWKRNGRSYLEQVVDEIADVRIMIEQMTLLFGADAVAERVEFKLERLRQRMERRKAGVPC